MADTARVIVTLKCRRHCVGCANTYPHILAAATRIDSVNALAGYQSVCITGGEPMQDPERTLRIARDLRDLLPKATIYLYTAIWSSQAALLPLMDIVDGLQYTLHDGATERDVDAFRTFQDFVGVWGHGKSLRLKVDPRVVRRIPVAFSVWTAIKNTPWRTLDNCVVPAHEDLFLLDEEYAT